MSWLYVPVSEGWNLASDSPVLQQPSFVLWRGKPLLPQSWSRACKRASWTKHLSGLTFDPLTADRGVESWIASRRAIRASRSLSRDHAAALRMIATCGRTSHASSERLNPQRSFWRTSPAIYPSDSIRSAPTFTAWVFGLRQEYSRRRKSGHHTDESGCSSSRWQTPAKDQFEKRRQVGQTERTEELLPAQAKNWPTPRAEMDSGRHRGETDTLHSASKQWATPNSHDGRRPGHEQDSTQGANLKRDAERWATPTARDYKDGATTLENTPVNCLLGRQVLVATGPTSPSDSGPRSLNPNFVESLMGLPVGWTGFEPVGTAWSHWYQRMRSELSRLR